MARQRLVPSGELAAVLLDLDNTLCATDHLNEIRINGDAEQLAPHLPELCSYPGISEVLEALATVLPVGIVSRSRRWYLDAVVRHLFPNVRWAASVSYDDVEVQKPHPAGLLLAAQQVGIADHSRIAYLGDSKDDVEAAYHAGMRPVLCTWEPSRRTIAKAGELIPDAVLATSGQILTYAADPSAFLPLLEARLEKRKAPAGSRRAVYLVVGPKQAFRIHILGRYFANAGPTLALHQRHLFSRWMAEKEKPGRFEKPGLVAAVAEVIDNIVTAEKITTVTVIPAKTGRTPRLEQLLAGVRDYLRANNGSRLTFDFKLLEFAEDAEKIKYLNSKERRAEVERSLTRIGDCEGKRILLVDDVLTSGGTMVTARQLLREGGATYVAGLALAKTIARAAFKVDPTSRECPQCERPLRFVARGRNGPFWSCTGYKSGACNYTENP